MLDTDLEVMIRRAVKQALDEHMLARRDGYLAALQGALWAAVVACVVYSGGLWALRELGFVGPWTKEIAIGASGGLGIFAFYVASAAAVAEFYGKSPEGRAAEAEQQRLYAEFAREKQHRRTDDATR